MPSLVTCTDGSSSSWLLPHPPPHTSTHTHTHTQVQGHHFLHSCFPADIWCLLMPLATCKYCGGLIHSLFHKHRKYARCLKFIRLSAYLKFLQHLELQRVLKRSFIFFFLKIFLMWTIFKVFIESCFCFMFVCLFFLVWEACGILVPLPGTEPACAPLHSKAKP